MSQPDPAGLDRWLDNRGVRLHFLDPAGAAEPARTPLVIVPGLSEGADEYRWLIDALIPRRCVALSLRGRGRSDAPLAGYSLDDHVSDLEALVEELRLQRFCLFGNSRGVAYAVRFAAMHPERVAGLVVGDYPAHHTELPEDWVDAFMQSTWRGVPVAERLRRRVAVGIQRDSTYQPLWEGLRSAPFPALILRGTADGSLLPRKEADRYRRLIPEAIVVALEGSDHDLCASDPERFVRVLEGFLGGLDGPSLKADRSRR
jgi:pimeloyl-ACP methyl ester carboxylesterase